MTLKIIYCSTTGNDSNDGLTPSKAVKSVEVGLNKIKTGGVCALRRGKTFTDADSLYPGPGGASASAPAALATYGTGPRPKLTGDLRIGSSTKPVSNFYVSGIDFTGKGPQLLGPGDNIVFQLCSMVGGPGDGLVLDPTDGLRASNVLVRNCLIADRIIGAKGSCLYAASIDGLRIEDSVFDNFVGPANIFSHNLYIQQGCTGVALRRIASCRASSHGIQMRSGGIADDVLLINNPIASSWGGGTVPVAGGVTADMRRCVTLGGGDIGTGPGTGRGWAIECSNLSSGIMSGNVIADGTGGDQSPLMIDGSLTGQGGNPMVGVLNLTVSGNVRRKWGGSVETGGTMTGTTVSGMDEQTDLYGVNLALTSFGVPDLFAALRLGALTAAAPGALLATTVNAIVRARLGMMP